MKGLQLKRIIVVAVILEVMLLSCSDAQLLKSYGVKAAYTSANQNFDYSSSTANLGSQRRAGYNVAVFAEWLNLPIVSVITQVEYAQRGMKFDVSNTGPENPDIIIRTVTEKNRLDYLSIPVLVKLTLPSAIVHPYLLAGPRIDCFLSYQSDDNLLNPFYDDFKKTEIGASFGGGIELSTILPVGVLIEARYNLDLQDSYSSNNWKVRNNSFDIWLGVTF